VRIVNAGNTFVTLTKRAHFLKIQASEYKFITPRMILLALPLAAFDIPLTPNQFYIGFTVTKTIGGAVERNSVKRRLRQILPEALSLHGNPLAAYAIIARKAALKAEFTDLKIDLERGIQYLCRKHSFLPSSASIK
jgi:ribonuclease P protein component